MSRIAALLLLAACLEARTLVVNQRHARAADSNPGTAEAPFKTIGAAAQLAQPGDRVLVHAGVYRERVAPARGGEEGRPIVYEAAPGAPVYLRGSEVLRGPWRRVEAAANLWCAPLEAKLFGAYNPFRIRLLGRKSGAPAPKPGEPDPYIGTLGQVLVDGRWLEEALTEEALRAAPEGWMVLPGADALLIRFPPTVKNPKRHRVEVSVRPRIFAPLKRGLGWITVRGFVMEHCANQYPAAFWSSETPQAGALGTRGGHHWVIENNLIRHAKSIGLDCGSEGRHDADGLGQPMPAEAGDHLIRNNIVSENGVCGIAGYRHRRTRISGNIVDRNNLLGLRSFEEAGIKLHLLIDGVVEGNLLRGNLSRAIWMDNRNTGSRVTRNVCLGSGAQGIFIELDSGPLLVDSNAVGRSRLENHPPDPRGDGIYMHDASAITLAHNLLFDNPDFGVNLRVVTSRGMNTASGKVEASNNRIVNNIFAANGMGALSIPFPDARAHGNFSDGNLFDAPGPFLWSTLAGAPLEAVRARAGAEKPVLRSRAGRESGVALELDDWRRLAGFDKGSAAGMVQVRLDEASLTLEIEIDRTASAAGTQAVAGIERDFSGAPMPAGQPLPSPFQNLKEGRNRIRLWPVEGCGAPPRELEGL